MRLDCCLHQIHSLMCLHRRIQMCQMNFALVTTHHHQKWTKCLSHCCYCHRQRYFELIYLRRMQKYFQLMRMDWLLLLLMMQVLMTNRNLQTIKMYCQRISHQKCSIQALADWMVHQMALHQMGSWLYLLLEWCLH